MNRPFSTATFVAAVITTEEDNLLHHPTTDHLCELGLVGMARALEEMRRQPDLVQGGPELVLVMGVIGLLQC